MHVQIKDQMEINASASEVWRVIAHEFDQIGKWSSGITDSNAIPESAVPDGAFVGGRVCLSNGIGGDVQEEFTYYDEQAKRFSYEAIGDLPLFFKSAENNWHVESLGSQKSMVEFRAEVDLKPFPGIFLYLMMPIIKKVWGTRTLEELKFFIENDQPHPRKLKAQQKQMKLA